MFIDFTGRLSTTLHLSSTLWKLDFCAGKLNGESKKSITPAHIAKLDAYNMSVLLNQSEGRHIPSMLLIEAKLNIYDQY